MNEKVFTKLVGHLDHCKPDDLLADLEAFLEVS